MQLTYKIADTIHEYENGKSLFKEYANSLNVDLKFQDFTKELETIDEQYSKPRGALILAFKGKFAVACVGIREFDLETAELKRMYVMPEFRGLKIGIRLLELSLEIAYELKYNKIRLDTLPEMKKAQSIYRMFGFYEIPSYRFNPVKGTVYMESKLVPKN